MLCVSLAAPDRAGLAQRLAQVEGRADMVEIRLDHVAEEELEKVMELISRCRLPVIATNRPVEQGGRFRGTAHQRLSILKRAVEAKADFVDVELETMEAVAGTLAEYCSCKGCRLIISYHDFHGTPGLDEIRSIIRRIAGFGPNVAKVVTTARLPEDVKTILATYCVSDLLPFDLVAFAMGEIGGMSRIACLALGAPFTYVALSREEATAPGQLDLDTVRSIVSVAEPEEPLV